MGREAHREVWEGLAGPPGGPGGVGRPTGRSGRGWEAYREGSGVLSGGPGSVWRLTRRSWRGREALPVVWVGSGVPLGGLGGVGRPNPKVREESGGPLAMPGGVVRNTRRSRMGRETHLRCDRGRETHPYFRERSGGPHRGSAGVGRPTWKSRRGR